MLSTAERQARQREARRTYNASEKGRASQERYWASEKGQAVLASRPAYRASDAGKAAQRRGDLAALERNHARHDKRVAKARTGGCTDCGSREDLHFHHLDPATKLFAISSMVMRTDEQFDAEVAKCVVVCQPCHVERHRLMDPSAARSEAPVAPLALMPASSDAEETA